MAVVLHKEVDPASHDIRNRMVYLIPFDNLTTFMERCHIIINSLCWADFFRNLYPKTIGIMTCKLVIVYDLCAWCFIRVHTAIAIGFVRHMILNFRIILVVFCLHIDEYHISTICAKRFFSHKKYVLYFAVPNGNSLLKFKCIF